MGRYAFFNTGLEYKFRFGVQDSNDITLFGGTSIVRETPDSTHTWTSEDKEVVAEKLKVLLEWLGEPSLDFALYEKTVDGTWKLKSELYDLFHKDHDEELVARYILGCLIYHQLLYEKLLQVDYEG